MSFERAYKFFSDIIPKHRIEYITNHLYDEPVDKDAELLEYVTRDAHIESEYYDNVEDKYVDLVFEEELPLTDVEIEMLVASLGV